MNVGVRLTVHWTDGPPQVQNALAWVSIPEKMPYYVTPAFKELTLHISILKSFRDRSAHDEFAIAVAHELSHVVLESIQHPLRKEEKAVDLTAMLLGFSYMYRLASHTRRYIGNHRFQTTQLGYLNSEDMDAACRILVPTKLRARRTAMEFAKRNAARLVVFGVICCTYLLVVPFQAMGVASTCARRTGGNSEAHAPDHECVHYTGWRSCWHCKRHQRLHRYHAGRQNRRLGCIPETASRSCLRKLRSWTCPGLVDG
jgi:hypothetical protein